MRTVFRMKPNVNVSWKKGLTKLMNFFVTMIFSDKIHKYRSDVLPV
jgi:hypothetical protein